MKNAHPTIPLSLRQCTANDDPCSANFDMDVSLYNPPNVGIDRDMLPNILH
jgi:hypothetical protein